MGYLAPGEIFENLLLLKRFGLYFEGILNRSQKMALFIYRCNDISYRDAKRFVGACSPKNFELIDAVWCNIDVLF